MSRSLELALAREAGATASALQRRGTKLVLAESCTGGLISASLAGIPGISKSLCGSAVTYRTHTKSAWLGIPVRSIENWDAVSARTAVAMARATLRKTPEADVAFAITGHLGPLPRRDQGREGQVFVAGVSRRSSFTIVQEFCILPQRTPSRTRDKLAKITRSKIAENRLAQVLRKKRQILASHAVLFMVRSMLNGAF